MNVQVSKPKTICPSPPGPSSGQPRLQEGSLEADRWTSPGPLHIHQGEQHHLHHCHQGEQHHVRHPHCGVQLYLPQHQGKYTVDNIQLILVDPAILQHDFCHTA